MAIIPPKFRKSGDSQIASYDYNDLAEGTGIVTYYFHGTNSSGSYTYNLVNETIHSDIRVRDTQVVDNVLDLDFDLSTYNLPRTIRGEAKAILGWGCSQTGSGSAKPYFIVRVRKWDGTTETEIAQGRSDSLTLTGTQSSYSLWCVPITIPETRFKSGETLRVSVQGTMETAGSNTSGIFLGHNPTGGDGQYIKPSTSHPQSITNSRILMPYKIQE